MTLLVLSIAVDAGPSIAGACGARTESVLVQRASGFAGAVERFVVDRAGAGAAGAEVLALTTGQRFRKSHARYLLADLCCDRFVYTVVAGYADGRHAVQPSLLLVVVRLMTAGAPVVT